MASPLPSLSFEARYRLKEGKGIRVSHPGELEEWLKSEGLELDDREHVITDAGCLVPGFSFENGGFEIFVHSEVISTDEICL